MAFIGETETHTRNYNGIYIRGHIGQNLDPLLPVTPDFEPPLHLAKALIVLSASWLLGEINACFAVTHQTEIAAWCELLLRQRVNDAARANLLAFAAKSDLEHLAAFCDVQRKLDEDDEAFRRRIQAKIMVKYEDF